MRQAAQEIATVFVSSGIMEIVAEFAGMAEEIAGDPSAVLDWLRRLEATNDNPRLTPHDLGDRDIRTLPEHFDQ